MPSFTIKETLQSWRQLKFSKNLKAVLDAVVRIFSFEKERQNRLKRAILVTEDYRAGVLVADIEKKYGCSRNTVLRYAREAGLEKRSRLRAPEGTKAAALAMYEQGKPIAEIAVRLGISQSAVSQYAQQAGVLRRTFKKRETK